jgi:uncharacterized glyoxalase superfamily protein PhnB
VQFRYTIFYVEDVPATIAWYERAFGMARGFVHDSGDYGELLTGETKLAFSSIRLMQQLGKSPAAPSAQTPVFEIAFETSDVAAAYQKALEGGATAVQPPRQEPWGQTTSYVSDLNGYLVEICSPVAAL